MNAVKYFASVALFTLASLSGHAFASGYGPAPHYSPVDGAPASQRGQSAQTLAAESKAPSQTPITAVKSDGSESDSAKEFANSNSHGSAAVQ